jgi:predicted permease
MTPRGVKRLFAFPFRIRADVRTDVSDEFAFHLDMRTEELVRLGQPEAEARAQALREFGNAAGGAAVCVREGDRLERGRRISRWLSDLRQDVSIAFRLLGRSPGFAVVAVLTLALGIGANVAIFSTLDAVLLRPLPYERPDRLVQIFETLPSGSENSVSGGAFLDWRHNQTQFNAITLIHRITLNLRDGGATERLAGIEASHEFLEVLGVSPLLGRGFIPEDDANGGRNDVVLLTEGLWRTRFGGDSSIVNRTIVLDGTKRTIVGVLPAGAWLFREDAFVIPAVLRPGTPRAARVGHWALVLGRLQPQSTLVRAEAELKAIKRRLDPEYPESRRAWGVGLKPLPEMVGGPKRPALLVLLTSVSVVLLIACANVANLLLARGLHRQQEMALRTALGASGARIVRQILTESVILALVGGLAGVVVAWGGIVVLRRLTADLLPPALAPQLDLRVLAFALGVTMTTGLLFGVLPALRARRSDLNDTLKNGGKNATASSRGRAQSALIMIEVTLTVVLLTAAGLLFRSLANTARADPGFDPGRVLALDISLPRTTYDSHPQRVAFMNALLARLRAVPGVEAAGAGIGMPFSGGAFGEYFRRLNETSVNDERIGRLNFVSSGYLEALGARLITGRTLTDADLQPTGARVAVISATTARAIFATKPPVGERLNIAAEEWTVVGVVADIVDRHLDELPRLTAWVPLWVPLRDPESYSIAVRTSLPPLSLAPGLHREIARLDGGVAMANPRSLDAMRTGSMAERRMVLLLVGAFAIAALILASIGLYGVMAYSVATRRREICIRMALGAVRADVMRHVLRDGLTLTGSGLVLGLLVAAAAARLLTTQLFQVESDDPLVIAGAVVTVSLVALAATSLPALRATRFEPNAALRNE